MKITVTAGHGGGDPGAVSGQYNERDLMAQLRDIVAAKLRAAGHDVKTDGGKLQNLPLAHALTLARGADCAIELHMNASTSPKARGVEVVSLRRDKLRAQIIARNIAKVLDAPLRGDGGWIDQAQTARGRLGFVNAGGLVVEVCFISNPDELARYLDRHWLVATAIAEAVGA
jgi:N-acetylmuramoyl-L-alanine amidase